MQRLDSMGVDTAEEMLNYGAYLWLGSFDKLSREHGRRGCNYEYLSFFCSLSYYFLFFFMILLYLFPIKKHILFIQAALWFWCFTSECNLICLFVSPRSHPPHGMAILWGGGWGSRVHRNKYLISILLLPFILFSFFSG